MHIQQQQHKIYAIYSKESAEDYRLTRIFRTYGKSVLINGQPAHILHKVGFYQFYFQAVVERPIYVFKDIVTTGNGYYLCHDTDDEDEDEDEDENENKNENEIEHKQENKDLDNNNENSDDQNKDNKESSDSSNDKNMSTKEQERDVKEGNIKDQEDSKENKENKEKIDDAVRTDEINKEENEEQTQFDYKTIIQPLSKKNRPNDLHKQIYKKRLKFVQNLNDKFIDCENILIDYIIKKANMENTFANMNNDVKSVIFKMLHPLNINEKDLDISNIDQSIRKHIRHTFDCDYGKKKMFLVYQPYFYNLMMNQLLKRFNYNYEYAHETLEIMKQEKMDILRFRQCAIEMNYNLPLPHEKTKMSDSEETDSDDDDDNNNTDLSPSASIPSKEEADAETEAAGRKYSITGENSSIVISNNNSIIDGYVEDVADVEDVDDVDDEPPNDDDQVNGSGVIGTVNDKSDNNDDDDDNDDDNEMEQKTERDSDREVNDGNLDEQNDSNDIGDKANGKESQVSNVMGDGDSDGENDDGVEDH